MENNLLFRPGAINGLRLKNRIVMPAMGTGFAGWTGEASEDLIAYFEARAKGGAGLIITEYCRVDGVTGASSARQLALYDMKHIAGIEKLALALHRHGTKLFVQLYHPGYQTSRRVLGGQQQVAPSEFVNPSYGETARALTLAECEELVGKFAASAVMAKTAGADGVELHGAHGYLINQFLSPYTNKRTDKYGGDLAGRMRFLTEIIEQVRALCGRDFPISVRLSADEFVEGGLVVEETVQIAKRLEECQVDAINVSCGIAATMNTFMEPYFYPEGWRKHLSKAVKDAVGIPVIAVNTVKHPAFARELLEEGCSDFVAVGRGMIADPEWARKAAQGMDDDICPCIGCLYCLNEYLAGRRVKCAVNPANGRERDFPAVAEDGRGRKAVVVGGGPGGLESATLLARRGFAVTLLEKSARLGGTLNAANKCEGKELITEYIRYLEKRARGAGVDIRLGAEAGVEQVKAEHPDAVVYAAGGGLIVPDIPGVRAANVCRWDQVLDGAVELRGKRVAVIGGGVTGLEVAEYLTAEGLGNEVTVVEMQDGFAQGVCVTVRLGLLKKLGERGVDLRKNHRLLKCEADRVLCEDTQGGGEAAIPCDAVVLALGVTPDRAQRESFENAGFAQMVVVGDANRGGLIADAVREGRERAMSIV